MLESHTNAVTPDYEDSPSYLASLVALRDEAIFPVNIFNSECWYKSVGGFWSKHDVKRRS